MRSVHRLLQIILLGTVIISAGLRAEEPVALAAPSQPELTWCLDHFSRFHHYEDVAQPYGPSVDLMRELAQRVGFKLRFTPRTPVSRCFKLMAEGKVDLMSNLKFSADRDSIMFLLPYDTTVAESIFLRRNDKRRLSHLSQIKNLSIASIRGYLYRQTTMQLLQQQRASVAQVDSIEIGGVSQQYIDSTAYRQDSTYWSEIRPLPLTEYASVSARPSYSILTTSPG